MLRIKVIGTRSLIDDSTYVYRNEYEFVYDAACREYDWLWVDDRFPKKDVGSICSGREELACPRENTILTTQEPVSIKSYGRAFVRQFGHLLTNRPQKADNHPNYHLGRGYMDWIYGKTYNQCLNDAPINKVNLISTVCFSKDMRLHTNHHCRLVTTRYLSEHIKELDWFGHGINALEKKYEALDSYKYHIAIENHIAPHHWTDKLSDSILGRCLTFYCGDPLVEECFPKEAFIAIPSDNPSRALAIINEAIANDEYSKRREAIEVARNLILEKYNPYAQIVNIIEGAEKCPSRSCGHDNGYICSRHRLRLNPVNALTDAFEHILRLR